MKVFGFQSNGTNVDGSWLGGHRGTMDPFASRKRVLPVVALGQSRVSGKSAAAMAASAMSIIALLVSSGDSADSSWLRSARRCDVVEGALLLLRDGVVVRFGF